MLKDFFSGSRGVEGLFEQELRMSAKFLRYHNQLILEYLPASQNGNIVVPSDEQDSTTHISAEQGFRVDGLGRQAASSSLQPKEQDVISGASVPISQFTMGKAMRRRREKILNESGELRVILLHSLSSMKR